MQSNVKIVWFTDLEEKYTIKVTVQSKVLYRFNTIPRKIMLAFFSFKDMEPIDTTQVYIRPHTPSLNNKGILRRGRRRFCVS